MLASDVVTDVANTLLDPGIVTNTGVAWSQAEILSYLSAGQLAAAMQKRDIAPIVGPVPLVAGSVQQLPATGLQVIDAYYNVGSGNAVLPGTMRVLDRMVPNWRAMTPSIDVVDYFTDERSPLIFHVSPPNNGSGALQMLYGALPALVTTMGQTLALPDIWRQALWAFVCGTAYAKNSRRQDLVKSQGLISLFDQWISGGKVSQAEVAKYQPDGQRGEA